MNVTQTSIDAYLSVKNLGEKQSKVLEAIEELEPIHDQAIAKHLGWTINRVTPRRGELVKLGKIEACGITMGDNERMVKTYKVVREADSADTY